MLMAHLELILEMVIIEIKTLEFDYIRQVIQENFKLTTEELAERDNIIEKNGYNSNERILIDEDIKNYFEDSQENLK